MKSKKGFTLLELLVVILIIGILAGIAIPQYQKAKEKSEAGQLLISIKALYDAQQRYYLVNEEYATKFDELDVNFSGYQRGGCEILSGFNKTDCISNNKNLIYASKGGALSSLRKTGKYLRSGFGFTTQGNEYIDAGKLYCYEHGKSGFCSELFNCNFLHNSGSNYYYSCKF